MGKVIRFELKKLVSRIGIYILVLFMAGILVASAFMYNPTERPSTSLSLVGETVSDMYSSFTSGLKDDYLAIVDDVKTNASTYISTSSSYIKYNNANEINKLFNQFDDYCHMYSEASATEGEYSVLLVGINESLQQLKNALDTTLTHTKNSTGYYILTTSDNYTKLYSALNGVIANFDAPVSHKLAGEKYYSDYRENLCESLDKLVYPNLESTAIKYAENGTYYALITLRMGEIADKMEMQYNKVLADSNLNTDKTIKAELNKLFNRYANCAKMFETSYSSSMCVDALYSVKGKTARSKLVGYGDVSLYEQEQISLEYEYYIKENLNSTDFANSLSVTHTSNDKANAYDFSYFVMSLLGVLIIIFAIYWSATTISGEINNNTMRFTAIRPVKRGSLFFGKYLAVVLMSLILLIFGAVSSFIVGGIMFGFESANILMIINSSFVIVAHPMAVLAIYVLSLLLLLALYSAFTIMLSACFKSDLLTMIIGVMVYVVNLVLPLFFGAGSWLRFYPGTNINLFAYFGSTRLTSDSILGELFNNVVYHGMNMWITLVYIIGITALLLLIGKTIFKKREL